MKYTLVRDKLGYMRCDPIPSQAELDKLYKEEFYTEAKPRYIERQEDDKTWWDAMYEDRLNILDDIVDEISPTILDIGCGGGFFGLHCSERSRLWFCFGVEPNRIAREIASRRTVWTRKSIDDVDCKFNAIHISEVLEHIPNPLQMLQDCHRMLFDGGAICVVVPNEKFNYSTLVYPHVFQPPQHINYFDFDSLESLMRQAGFEIYERSTMYPMETFLQMGLDYTKSEGIGRLCHHMRMAFDLSMTSQQRRKFYRELAQEGLGRECVIYAIKKG